jgi:porphobilinogen synthase
MVRETQVEVGSLVAPLFVVPGSSIKREISSMPGQHQLSVDGVVNKAQQLRELGVKSVLLFAIPDFKDDIGSSAWKIDGLREPRYCLE